MCVCVCVCAIKSAQRAIQSRYKCTLHKRSTSFQYYLTTKFISTHSHTHTHTHTEYYFFSSAEFSPQLYKVAISSATLLAFQCMHACMHVCMYVCMYIYVVILGGGIYVYIYIYIYVQRVHVLVHALYKVAIYRVFLFSYCSAFVPGGPIGACTWPARLHQCGRARAAKARLFAGKTYIYMEKPIYIYIIYMYVYMYVCMYIYIIYIYTYIYTLTRTHTHTHTYLHIYKSASFRWKNLYIYICIYI